MSGRKSLNKGKAYERKISKLLSHWCGIELIRTPMSGAWPGTCGDILPKDRSQHFPFLVECKCQETWCMEQFLGGSGQLASWLQEVYIKATKDVINGHPINAFMIIFTRNHKSNYIAYPSDLLPYHPKNVTHIHAIHYQPPLTIFELAVFLHLYNYQEILASSTVGLPLEPVISIS